MANPQEILDIVNVHGDPTGEIALKREIHAEGRWHRDTHVWITNGTHMLEQQRTWDKDIMPGQWDISASGHVGQGESYLDASVREIKEEVGLKIAPERLIPIGILAVEMIFPGWSAPHRTVGQNYVVVEPDLALEQVTLQAEEVVGARLYLIDQLEFDLRAPETARQHAQQPLELWCLGIAGMRAAAYNNAL